MSTGETRTAIRLRPPVEDDCATMRHWRTDPETQQLLMFGHLLEGLEEVKAWVARRTGDAHGLFRIIATPDGDRPAGFAQLTRIDRDHCRAELGLFVEDRLRGTGAAADALHLMEAEAAGELGLHKIVIEVLAANERALRFWKANDYETVGTLKEHYRYDGAFYDVQIMEKRIGR